MLRSVLSAAAAMIVTKVVTWSVIVTSARQRTSDAGPAVTVRRDRAGRGARSVGAGTGRWRAAVGAFDRENLAIASVNKHLLPSG